MRFLKNRKWLLWLTVSVGALVAAALVLLITALALPLRITAMPDTVVAFCGGKLPAYQVEASWLNLPVQFGMKTTGDVNLSKPGTYTQKVTVQFLWFTDTREQTVVVLDREKPIITLNHIEGSYTLPGHAYEEEGFTATDNCDGDISHLVQKRYDKNAIIYFVKDSSGNTQEVCRYINYQDYEAPELTLKGNQTITIMAGSSFADPGYIASDNADGDVTDKVKVTGNYSIYMPGTYTITYEVADSFGNVTTKTRTLVIQGYTNPSTVQPDGKVIYLTFDDGPSGHTPRLLQILAKYNVKATFFVVGTAATGYIDDIYNAGHAVGLHTNTHAFQKVYASVDAYYQDLYAIQNKVYNATGTRPTIIRFPGGSSNTISRNYCYGIMSQLVKSVQANGFQYFDWNVDSMDAGGARTSDQVFNNVVNGVKGRKVSVVLQHDIHGFSVDAVERIIQWGLANGYTFQKLTPTSPTAHHGVLN